MKRNFYPGDEWLYYKVYCGKHTANELLIKPIKLIVETLLKEKKISSWFFIRYEDPDSHLRIRFKLKYCEDLSMTMTLVLKHFEAYLKNRAIWKLQIDTYNREIERYGKNRIALVEEVFFFDSEIINRLIKKINNEETYLIHIIKSINQIFTDFHLDKQNRLDLLQLSLLGFQKEFNVDLQLKKQLNKRYGLIKEQLKKTIKQPNNLIDDEIEFFFNYRSSTINLLNEKIIGISETEKQNIILSIVHMNLNRAFKDNQRFLEMICYDFLVKYHISNRYLEKAKLDQKKTI